MSCFFSSVILAGFINPCNCRLVGSLLVRVFFALLNTFPATGKAHPISVHTQGSQKATTSNHNHSAAHLAILVQKRSVGEVGSFVAIFAAHGSIDAHFTIFVHVR